MSEHISTESEENTESRSSQSKSYTPERRSKWLGLDKYDLSTEGPEDIDNRPIIVYRDKEKTLEVVNEYGNAVHAVGSGAEALAFIAAQIEQERSTSTLYLERLEEMQRRISGDAEPE